eukprot:evm.model.scf_4141.1 EVM.evm.TU.scf_4141.1   scf_4141:1377-3295(+)
MTCIQSISLWFSSHTAMEQVQAAASACTSRTPFTGFYKQAARPTCFLFCLLSLVPCEEVSEAHAVILNWQSYSYFSLEISQHDLFRCQLDSNLTVLFHTQAHMLQMEPPELYVRQSPVPNAYTLAIAGRKPFIVVHTSLVELLTPAELQAVISHELGHLKCDHGVWLTVANVLALGTLSVLPVISNAVEEGLMRWLRAAELTCDRCALLVAQDRRVVISALMKLAGGTPSLASELNIDAFLQQ